MATQGPETKIGTGILFPQPARFAEKRPWPFETISLKGATQRVRIVQGDLRIIFGAVRNSKGGVKAFITSNGGVEIASQRNRKNGTKAEPKTPPPGKNLTCNKDLTSNSPKLEIGELLEIELTGNFGELTCFLVSSPVPVKIEPIEYSGDFNDYPL